MVAHALTYMVKKKKVIDPFEGYVSTNLSTIPVTTQLQKVSDMRNFLFNLSVSGRLNLGGGAGVKIDSLESAELGKDMLVNFLSFSITASPDSPANETAVKPLFRFYIKDILICVIGLPPNLILAPNWTFNQIVDVSDFVIGVGSKLKIELTADDSSVGADGYGIIGTFSITGLSI